MAGIPLRRHRRRGAGRRRPGGRLSRGGASSGRAAVKVTTSGPPGSPPGHCRGVAGVPGWRAPGIRAGRYGVANIGVPVIPAWPDTWPLALQAGRPGIAAGRGRNTPSRDAVIVRLAASSPPRPGPAGHCAAGAARLRVIGPARRGPWAERQGVARRCLPGARGRSGPRAGRAWLGVAFPEREAGQVRGPAGRGWALPSRSARRVGSAHRPGTAARRCLPAARGGSGPRDGGSRSCP